MPPQSIWIDITELFDQFKTASHPTGVARTIMQLTDALAADPGSVFGAARPLFWHPLLGRPLTTGGAVLSPLAATFPQLSRFYAQAGLAGISYTARPMKAIATSLPKALRYRLFPADNGVALFSRWAQRQGVRLIPAKFAPGDALFVPGSFWLGRYMGRLMAQASGTPMTAFVHDVLLLSHPEWLPGRHSEQFRHGCEAVLPRCAAIVCNSRHTRSELRRLVRLPPDLRIEVCRLGDQATTGSSPGDPRVTEMLGKPYVLFVSSMVPRKNHRLLVEAWAQLWQALGPTTPYLLFVGGGAPDGALARHAAAAGRIVRLSDVDDGGLHALYKHALMTAYPSLGEGYGLPVAEALSHGKVCLAAPNESIREISPDLVDFIDPHDPASVVAVVRRYLADPRALAAREGEIRNRYRATSWPEAARTIRAVIEGTVPAGADGASSAGWRGVPPA